MKELNMPQQLLCLLNRTMDTSDNILGYQGEYLNGSREYQQDAYGLLKFYGWSFGEEEEEIIDGSSKLYKEG